ncbi:MAG: serine/threonine-protein kinase HipA [Colwellia sp.]|jgi:serine/threonine-protein kinase HipA
MMTATKRIENVEGLALSINGQNIGILTHYSSGRNIFVFSPEYKALAPSVRQTFTMTQLGDREFLSSALIRSQKLPPVLSNLLPEGALREWMARTLKVHADNEFPLMAHMGQNLPGALKAKPILAGDVPQWALDPRDRVEPIQVNVEHSQNKFSLAGVQMKFSSMMNKDGRFNIEQDSDTDSWIIKTPSTQHRFVPYNEYSAMRLAESAGVDIPEIKLIKLTDLDNLPNIQLPNEESAYAIKRFDREDGQRIHTEDFAQVFQVYSHDKYRKHNYEQVADALYKFSSQGLKDVQQMARRLLVNILLANGDAHLKNWSLIYRDGVNPSLSPAYDILSTMPYIDGEQEFALNMAKNKNWYEASMANFEVWAKRVGFAWPAIKVHLQDTINIARQQWVPMLTTLPMHEEHQQKLKAHWKNLHEDFRIE